MHDISKTPKAPYPVREWLPGTPISEPGIYSGVPIEVYHSQAICDGPSISSSGLRKLFFKSPAHFHCNSEFNEEADDREAEREKEHMILGRAAHHLLLGESDFARNFVVRPPEFTDYRSNAAKAWRAAEEAKGLTVLLPKHIAIVRGMRDALVKHPFVGGAHILRGLVEQSLFWKDAKTGVWLKARPDVIPTASGDVVDLKTTSKTGPEDMDRAIFDLGYDMQGALVGMGLKAVLDIDMQSFSLVMVEVPAPHSVDLIDIASDHLAEATDNLRIAIDVFAHCLKTGDWFGPAGRSPGVRTASRSPWQGLKMQNRRAALAEELKG